MWIPYHDWLFVWVCRYWGRWYVCHRGVLSEPKSSWAGFTPDPEDGETFKTCRGVHSGHLCNRHSGFWNWSKHSKCLQQIDSSNFSGTIALKLQLMHSVIGFINLVKRAITMKNSRLAHSVNWIFEENNYFIYWYNHIIKQMFLKHYLYFMMRIAGKKNEVHRNYDSLCILVHY